jgi:hypothetical protein
LFSNEIVVGSLGDITVSGKETHVLLSMSGMCSFCSGIFAPVIDRALPLEIFYSIVTDFVAHGKLSLEIHFPLTKISLATGDVEI